MARSRRGQRHKIRAKGPLVGGTIGPKSTPCLPNRPQAFVVRHSVLDYESHDAARMGQGHAKTHRAAVILHVKRVARDPQRFGEAKTSHRQNDAELCLAAHHPRVSLACPFERVFLDHRTHARKFGEVHRVLFIGGRSGSRAFNFLSSNNEL